MENLYDIIVYSVLILAILFGAYKKKDDDNDDDPNYPYLWNTNLRDVCRKTELINIIFL